MRLPRRPARTLAAWLVAAAVPAAVATGALAASGATATTTTPSARPTPSTPSTGAPPLLDVTVGGGFTTPQAAFSTLPQYYVTADGRLVTPGPQIMIYPPPALTNLRSRQLSSTARTKLLAAATKAGLTKKAPEYGRPGVADVGTTTIAVRSGGKTWVHEIYALGFGEDQMGRGVSPTQQAARARVRAFLDALADPVRSFGSGAVGAEKAFSPSWFRVRATPLPPVDPTATTLAGDLPAAPARDWPVPTVDLAKADTCAAVPATPALLAALRQVTSIQQWRQAGVVYDATLRPLLPGEPFCP